MATAPRHFDRPCSARQRRYRLKNWPEACCPLAGRGYGLAVRRGGGAGGQGSTAKGRGPAILYGPPHRRTGPSHSHTLVPSHRPGVFQRYTLLEEVRSAFFEQCPQHGPVAALLVCAVAPHRQVHPMREGSEEVEEPGSLRAPHLAAISPFE